MKLTGTFSIPCPRPQVFAALADPAVLQQCIDGCDKMVRKTKDDYEAHLKFGVAGLKGNYTGTIRLVDQRPPDGYALLIEGKGVPGFVKGNVRLALAEQGAQTRIDCEAEVQVGGMIAAIGSRLIEPIAKKMMAEFFRKFGDKIKEAGKTLPAE